MPSRHLRPVESCKSCQWWHQGMTLCEEHGDGRVDWICDDWEPRGSQNLSGITAADPLRSALMECQTYFESRADVADYSDETGHTPNEEMRLLQEVEEALGE